MDLREWTQLPRGTHQAVTGCVTRLRERGWRGDTGGALDPHTGEVWPSSVIE